MPRTLLCCACLTPVEAEARDLHEALVLHVLDAGHYYPGLDVDAAFDGIVRANWRRP